MDALIYVRQLSEHVPVTVIIGIILIIGFFAGKSIQRFKLPMIFGYMITGVVLGPSILNIASVDIQQSLSFIVQIALALVALNIGLELQIKDLLSYGKSIIFIIFAESFMAFFLVTGCMYLLTDNIFIALAFGSVAPASAPAGTVAVIQEYKSKGRLTKALYAVVGFDDGLAIIIFGFVLAFLRFGLMHQTSLMTTNMVALLVTPFKEIMLSFTIGALASLMFVILARTVKRPQDTLVLIFGVIFIVNSLSQAFHCSLILSNLVMGLILGNIQKENYKEHIEAPLRGIMPFIYILYFVLAGANLEITMLSSLTIVGVVYVLSRTIGLVSGAWLGAVVGKAEPKIRKYLGLGILSQAGVAIGLSIIIKHDLSGLGKIIGYNGASPITLGDSIGDSIIATVTATCIFFEIIGPILTKIALQKAGEIVPAHGIRTLRRENMRFYRQIIDDSTEDKSISNLFNTYAHTINDTLYNMTGTTTLQGAVRDEKDTIKAVHFSEMNNSILYEKGHSSEENVSEESEVYTGIK